MLTIILTFIKDVYNSFNNTKPGFSYRKLAGFTGMLIACYVTMKHTNEHNIEVILGEWLIFVATCIAVLSTKDYIALKTNTYTKTKTTHEEVNLNNTDDTIVK